MATISGNQVIRDLNREIKKKWLFHPTEPQAAVVLDNGSICVLTGSSHSESFEEWSDMNLVDSTRSIVVISWSSSGMLASGCEDGTVLCWDVENGDAYFEGRKHTREITHVTWNPVVPEQLLSCCCERIIRIWDTENNELCYTIPAGQLLIFDIRWISEEVIATCTAGHSVQLYDVTTTRVIKELPHQGPVSAIVWDEESQHLISCSYDASIKVWCMDVEADVPWMELGNDESPVYCIDWLHIDNGKKIKSYLACGGADHFWVTIWDLRKKYYHQLGEGDFTDFIRDVRFSPDGQLLAAADNYGHVVVWNVLKWTKAYEVEVTPMVDNEPSDYVVIDEESSNSRPPCYRPLAFRCLEWSSNSDKLIISVDQPQVYVVEFHRRGSS